MSKKEPISTKQSSEEPVQAVPEIKRPAKGVNPPEARPYDPITMQPTNIDKGKALREWLNNAKNASTEGLQSTLIDPKQAIYAKKGDKKNAKKTTH